MVSISIQPDYVAFTRSKREAKQLRVEPVHIVPMPHVVGARVDDRGGSTLLAVDVRGDAGVPPEAHSIQLERADAERLRDQVQMHAAGDEATPWGARLPEEVGLAIAHARAQHQLAKEDRTTNRLMWASLGAMALPLILGGLVFVVIVVALFAVV